MSSPEVLFVSHDAGRTGAPLVLLNFQRWLKKHTDLKITTILRRSGPLEPEFAALGETFLIQVARWERILRERGASRLASKVGSNKRLAALRDRPHQLIYSNTITNGDVLRILARPGLPVITHVHELNYWINRSGPDNWRDVCRHTTKFVAVSEAVSRNLQQYHQIPSDRIEVVHEFIPVDGQITNNHEMDRGCAMRERLAIPANAFVVGGSGYETWRKGKDLFVQLAALLRRRSPSRPFIFVWVGAQGDEEERRQLQHDIEMAGIGDIFRWTGEVSNPLDYFACLDSFALVSREDPFPLVCLEAALMEKPIVCFAGAGGTAELIEQDSGFVVPYLDLNIMADKLLLLAEDEELQRRMGACGAAKVRERFSLEVMAPRLHRVIDSMLGQRTLV